MNTDETMNPQGRAIWEAHKIFVRLSIGEDVRAEVEQWCKTNLPNCAQPRFSPPAAAPIFLGPATSEAGAERGGGEPQSAVEWVRERRQELLNGGRQWIWIEDAIALARRCDAAEADAEYAWQARHEAVNSYEKMWEKHSVMKAQLAAAQAEAREYKKGLLILSKLGTGPCGGGGALDSYNHGIQEAEARVRKMARDYLAKHAKEGGR